MSQTAPGATEGNEVGDQRDTQLVCLYLFVCLFTTATAVV